MTYKGIAKGKTIEFQESLPYRNGQPVQVSIEPAPEPQGGCHPEAIRQAMREPPHLERDMVDELERAITQGRLPIAHQDAFDAERGR